MADKILAIGAHYDDCVFGIPGTLLKASDAGMEVHILSIIGDYSNWSPVGKERQNILIEGSKRLAEENGAILHFLEYASMGFEVDPSTKAAVSEVVAKIQPDVGFLLWPHDTHPDHEVASRLSKVAFHWAGATLGRRVARPKRLYYYDNGPRHTIDFSPNTFVNVEETWSRAMTWLGKLMALAVGETSGSGPIQAKTTLATYRGLTAGVSRAEGLRSFQEYPKELF